MYPWLTASWQHWLQAFNAGRLAHGWLITGPAGLGQSWLTEQMIRAFLCLQPTAQGACGVCHACRLQQSGHHPDLVLTGDNADKSIGIDPIRELIQRLNSTPQQGAGKVALIADAGRLTEPAANALLKTLEEPAGRSLLLLTCDTPAHLLPTLRSRCQRLELQVPSSEQALTWLHQQPGGAAASAWHLRLNQGAPLRVLDYLQQNDDAKRQQVLQTLQQSLTTAAALPQLVDALHAAGPTARDWLHWLLLDALKLQAGCDSSLLTMPDASTICSRLATLPASRLIALQQALLAEEESETAFPTSMPQLHLLNWCTLMLTEVKHVSC